MVMVGVMGIVENVAVTFACCNEVDTKTRDTHADAPRAGAQDNYEAPAAASRDVPLISAANCVPQ